MSARPKRQRPSTDSSSLQPNPQPIRVGDQVAPEPAPADSPQTSGLPESASSGVTDSGSSEVTESQSPEVPKYRTFVRKDARVRGDQADALAQLRRRLSSGRVDRSERITDNTLIRVAVDLLLEQSDGLAGETEEELTESVTHGLRNS